jgi:hypothetical protein
MSAPLNTPKATVDLAAAGTGGSRIRRDPPPRPAKVMTIAERDQRDRRTVVLGIAGFTLAMVAVLVGLSGQLGWNPRDVVIDIRQ